MSAAQAQEPQEEPIRLSDLPAAAAEKEQRRRELVRGKIAIGLMLLIGITIGGAYALVGLDRLTAEEAATLLERILSPLVVLTGTAFGFYFGRSLPRH